MFKGFVEWRTEQQIPYYTQLKIDFYQAKKLFTIGTVKNISSGGIQFYLPLESDFAKEGDQIELVFYLQLLGEQMAICNVYRKSFGIDHDLNRIIFYDVKFSNLPVDTWTNIFDYCSTPIKSLPEKTPQKFEQERKDIRVLTLFMAHVLYSGGKVPCLIEDISYGGVKIHVPVSLVINQSVSIHIKNAEDDLLLKGNVAWITPINERENEFRVGISFEQPDIELFNKLRSLLFKFSSSESTE